MSDTQTVAKKIKFDVNDNDYFEKEKKKHIQAISEMRKKFEAPKNYEDVICVGVLDFFYEGNGEAFYGTYYGPKSFEYENTFLFSLDKTSQKGLNSYRSELKKTDFFDKRDDTLFLNTFLPYKKEMEDYVIVFTEGKEDEQAKELADFVNKYF